MAVFRTVITTTALWLASTQRGWALALPVEPASPLTVDLGYASYQGTHNTTTGLNVWKGYVGNCNVPSHYNEQHAHSFVM